MITFFVEQVFLHAFAFAEEQDALGVATFTAVPLSIVAAATYRIRLGRDGLSGLELLQKRAL